MRRLILPYMRRLAWLPAFVTILWPLLAWARAGGGQHYSGGSSGGGSGGDGIDAAAVWFLVNLCIEYPPLGIAVVGGLGVYGIIKYLRHPDRTTRKALESMAANDNMPRNLDGLGSLSQRDPGFQLAALLARARSTVERVNLAWSDGDMARARGLISDAVYVRFRTQLRLLAAQGVRNRVGDFTVLAAEAVAVESDNDWDTVHVSVRARARDLDLPAGLNDAQAAARLAAAPLDSFAEIWSFARRVGAQTLAAGGALEGRCPECGAAVPPAETVRCEYCRAVVNSGTHDWVLAEITQAVEWEATSAGTRAIPGYDGLRERDPGLNRENVEDRASVLFWKWIAARVTGDTKGLARFISAEPSELGIVPGETHALERVAVGAADLVACDPAPVEGKERCYVRLKWSAAQGSSGDPNHSISMLILARRQGIFTPAGRMALVCHACRGPLDDSDAVRCAYCAADVGPGAQEWALEAVTSPQTAERLRAARAGAIGAATDEDAIDLPDLADATEREVLFWSMAGVLRADGEIKSSERRLLQRCARRWSIPQARVEAALAGPWPPTSAPARPLNPEDRTAFLTYLVTAALVDGRVDAKERKLLDAVALALEVPQAQLRTLIEERSRRASRAA